MTDMKRPVRNIQFYMKSDVNAWLYNKAEGDSDENIRFESGDDFSFDIIDQPFHCMVRADDDKSSIFLFIRSDLGVFSEEDADFSFVIYTNGDKPTGKSSGRLGGDAGKVFMQFLKAGTQLREYTLDRNLMDQFADLDLETEGVVVKLENDGLSFERVAGKRRPSMACTVLFGGIEMRRPYQDEILQSWLNELQSFDEKLEAAEAGDESAMGEVAETYLNGDEESDIEPDPAKAAYWFRKQAELDNPTGCFNLAILYIKGAGVEQNIEQALYWMKKAAENGDEDARSHVEKYTRIIELQKNADEGDTQAMADLAEELMAIGTAIGEDPEDDSQKGYYRKSVDLAKEAEVAGVPSAQWILALAHEFGRGVEMDLDKAVGYYQRGADLGHAGCQYNLGNLYLRGERVPEDKEKGFALYMKSAEQGHGLAMKAVGTCYQFGEGVEDSMKEAIKWYEKALEVIDDPELARKVMVFKTLPDLED